MLSDSLFRPWVGKLLLGQSGGAIDRFGWIIAVLLFILYLSISYLRLEGFDLWREAAAALVLPIPFLLLTANGRRAIGIKRPNSWSWLLAGTLVGVALALLCTLASYGVFGYGPESPIIRLMRRVPVDSHTQLEALGRLLLAALPFIPLTEEVLFRGMVQTTWTRRWSTTIAAIVQAALFAITHIPDIGAVAGSSGVSIDWRPHAVYLPSFFIVGITLGWIARKSESIWPSLLANIGFIIALDWVIIYATPRV